MPTASVLSDGALAFSASAFGPNRRYAATFQVLPRVYGTFRYASIDGLGIAPAADFKLFDRSFDLHFQIAEEGALRPAIGIGLRDILGTGVFASEYLVATKSVTPRLTATAGLGWGRLAGVGAFTNPLGVIDDRFETRPGRAITQGGELSTGSWFRGPTAAFGGVEFQATGRLRFAVEYSSDAYTRETAGAGMKIETPFNFGVTYQFANGLQAKGFVVGGTEVGVQFNYVIDPKRRSIPGGADGAPLALVSRDRTLLAGMDLTKAGAQARAQGGLAGLMRSEGLVLQGLTLEGSRAEARLENTRFDTEAQAVGRAARAMAVTLPATVETFVITFQHSGLPISSVTMQRADLEALETDFDGAWKSLARAQITDAAPNGRAGEVSGAFPTFEFGLGPYLALSFFDPDSPLRYEIGPQVTARYRPRPGLTFAGRLRYPVLGNIDDATRVSNSIIQKVRTDAVRYAQESELEINELTAEYLFRPGPDLFGRVTGGYLEQMYGGLSAEMLWYPVDSRLALGAEINFVKQRDFDMLFGFQDYETVTGHASAYYELGNGFTTQLDVGRYLAGDWGATLSVDRAFNNGFTVGGYFTRTNLSAAEFGEGSFDKGLRVTIPVSWLTGRSSRDTLSQTIQPVLRDGGARLNVNNRLYGVTRDYRGTALRDGWGRVFR